MTFYKEFIDNLVKETTSVSSKLIIKEGIYSRAIDDGKYNDFVGSLTKEQRKLLASMLENEREGGIHDVLAELTWWIDCHDVELYHKGETVKVGYGGGMHQDDIGRRYDWKWPDDNS